MIPTLTFVAGLLVAQLLDQHKEGEVRIISTALAFLTVAVATVLWAAKAGA